MRYLSIHNRTAAEDPLKAHNFTVDLSDFERLAFSKVTGLVVELAVAEYSEGGSSTQQKSPGKATYPDVTCERGQVISTGYGKDDMLRWMQQAHNSSAKRWAVAGSFRRDVTITQLANEGGPAVRWKTIDSWPRNHKAFSDLDASQLGQNQMETLIIVLEGYSKTL